jgi:CHAT domain-containing protein
MSDDPLKKLLQQADAMAGGPPEMPGDLARRVRLRAARRRRVRVGVSAAAAAIVLAVGTTLLWPQGSTLSPPANEPPVALVEQSQPDVARIEAEIERLRREADTRLAVVNRTQEILEEMKRLDELKKQPPVPDAVAYARREVDQAAYTLVSQADRMCRELDLCESAAVKYRRVVKLFPESCWAAVARQRLSELERKGDIS